jgi:hypothetical protein
MRRALLLPLATVTGCAAAPPQQATGWTLDANDHTRATVASPPTSRQVAQQVSQCGLAPVVVEFDRELDEDVLIAKTIDQATDQQLECADRAAGYYELVLPPAIQPRFETIRTARQERESLALARAWLAARNLLGRVPHYQAGVTNEATFTHQIESLCGPRAKGAFQSAQGFHTINLDWIRRFARSGDYSEAFTCLMHVTTVAGFKIGFVGNEYYAR